jgi:hypothetical protein
MQMGTFDGQSQRIGFPLRQEKIPVPQEDSSIH